MVKADSFAGRVLAVLSRRSPAFRASKPSCGSPEVIPERTKSGREPITLDWAELAPVVQDWAWLPGAARFARRDAFHSLDLLLGKTQRVMRDGGVGSSRALGQVLTVVVSLDREVADAINAHREHVSLGRLLRFRQMLRFGEASSENLDLPVENIADDLVRARVVLRKVADDFAGADLSAVDSSAIDLTDIEWDVNTCWPASTAYPDSRRNENDDTSKTTTATELGGPGPAPTA